MLRTTAANVFGATGAPLPLLFLILGCWLFIGVVAPVTSHEKGPTTHGKNGQTTAPGDRPEMSQRNTANQVPGWQ